MSVDEPEPPRVSVVIPVRNRRALLAQCLDGLDAQRYRTFEVVVADDGSSDGSGELAALRGATVVRCPSAGAVAARIAAVAAARGEVLAFTDSDCVPEPGWLEAGVRAIERGADIVTGVTRPTRPPAPLERSMASATEGLYPTCNVFFRRAAYAAAGGFDATATRWRYRPGSRNARGGFGEDTLLAWHVMRRGASIHAPDAAVRHAVFPADLSENIGRAVQVAGFPFVVREIPELRTEPVIRWRWQFGHRTRVPLYLALVAALAGRRDEAGLAAAWWVVLRLAELRGAPAPWRRRLAALPQELVIDVATGAALVIGSARARTPVF